MTARSLHQTQSHSEVTHGGDDEESARSGSQVALNRPSMNSPFMPSEIAYNKRQQSPDHLASASPKTKPEQSPDHLASASPKTKPANGKLFGSPAVPSPFVEVTSPAIATVRHKTPSALNIGSLPAKDSSAEPAQPHNEKAASNVSPRVLHQNPWTSQQDLYGEDVQDNNTAAAKDGDAQTVDHVDVLLNSIELQRQQQNMGASSVAVHHPQTYRDLKRIVSTSSDASNVFGPGDESKDNENFMQRLDSQLPDEDEPHDDEADEKASVVSEGNGILTGSPKAKRLTIDQVSRDTPQRQFGEPDERMNRKKLTKNSLDTPDVAYDEDASKPSTQRATYFDSNPNTAPSKPSSRSTGMATYFNSNPRSADLEEKEMKNRQERNSSVWSQLTDKTHKPNFNVRPSVDPLDKAETMRTEYSLASESSTFTQDMQSVDIAKYNAFAMH
eukprot:CAMPEP_0197079690 /NCGR_PEP_ID=MMETSP1384-20130603/213753_1 /TAXON_ID=29189 /ORGANISM="Ammonia sp." /LENGTH=442 /DNA_ID=CAMNT_0042518569 /DNA_START=575 /DNA_END=1901 /DNA_ORIENTATION=+